MGINLDNNLIILNKRTALAKVGEAGFLLIAESTKTDPEGRVGYRWAVLGKRAGTLARSKHNDKIWSGARGMSASPRDALGAFCNMLSAFAEARSSTSENWDLFPNEIRSWAQQNSDEIAGISLDLELFTPDNEEAVKALFAEYEDPRCEADAIIGTGTGVCNTRLTKQGDCPRSGDHI